MQLPSLLSTLALAAAVSRTTAQSSPPLPSDLPDPNTFVPGNATDLCKAFLVELNADPALKQCTDPLVTTMQRYTAATNQKGASATSDSNALTTALNDLCVDGKGCQAGLVKDSVSSFAQNCREDLAAKNLPVVALYDKLYLINPFRGALCSKDSGGDFCVSSLAKSGSVSGNVSSIPISNSPAASPSARSLMPRQDSLNGADTQTIETTNLPFLFITPDSPKEILCGLCLQNIIAAYIQFETAAPYAIGLKNSDILAGQSALYASAKKTCGASWAVGVNKIAGTEAFALAATATGLAARQGAAALVAAGAVAWLAL